MADVTAAVWQKKYGVTDAQMGSGVWLAEDSDADGLSNSEECVAGTNPFVGGSVVNVSQVADNGSSVSLTFPAIKGKYYVVQGSPSLTGFVAVTPAVNLKAMITGDQTLTTAKGGNAFFRLSVQDYDSDGDGVSDWVEREVGLNPADTASNPGQSDLVYLMEQIDAANEVVILASEPFASEDGPQAGRFTISRTQKLFPVTLQLQVSGTAVMGEDYAVLPNEVTMAAGVGSVDLSVNPLPNASVEGGESVTAELQPPALGDSSFVLGANDTATVIIGDSTQPTGTGLRARYYDTASSTYSNAANFNASELKIDRIDPTVNFSWLQGTPNGVVLPSPDNYSVVWEGYLRPTSANNYQFQLDADDKARVLVDLNRDGDFDDAGEQVVEHGWEGTAETIGTFKQSLAVPLVVPTSPAERYRIRVEFAETTGDARCRLQWRAGTAAYANIPSTSVFSHTRAVTYNYTRTSATAGTAVITPTGGHALAEGTTVALNFSSGNLFVAPTLSGSHVVTAVTGTSSFTVALTGSNLPASGTGNGFVADATSTTAGYLARYFPVMDFSGSPSLVAVNGAVTDGNNGIWGAGTPGVGSIHPDTFSVRWSGQVQPQFSEEYTFLITADDGVRLKVNGQVQSLKYVASTNSSGTYSYNSTTGNAVITHTSLQAGSFVVGELSRFDPTSGSASTLGFADRLITAVSGNTFTVNLGVGAFTTGTGNVNIEAINKAPNDWVSVSGERYVRMPMIGGTRYDIELDYFENTGSASCVLSWYSASQPRQIVPSNRLYPSSGSLAPPALVSETDATALAGGALSYPLLWSNGGTATVSGNPAWLTYNNGVLSGTPPAGSGGDYQILITLVNGAGTSTAVLNLRVDEPGGVIQREYWTGLAGVGVGSIPVDAAPTGTETLSSLEALTDLGDDFGERIRGYITAPLTGNYYFWIASSDAAELWISNDDEPVNRVKRAWVNTGSEAPLSWSAEVNQKSPWLALEQGKRYYIEVLRKAGVNPGDNLAIGWLKPGQSGNEPSEVVPGFVLAPWVELVPVTGGSNVYAATMRPQGGAATNASGSTFIRLNEAETEGIISIKYQGLTSAYFGMHVHDERIPGGGLANVVADLDEPGDVERLPDGSFKWEIKTAGGRSREQIVQDLKDGVLFFNVHSVLYPGGEIKGHFSRVEGSQKFAPPPALPLWTDDSDTNNGAARFLTQASFGPSAADIKALKDLTPTGGKSRYEMWIDDQFNQPASHTLAEVIRTEGASTSGGAFDETLAMNAWWRNSISGPDQLRQRLAFALSEILVVSGQGPLDNNARALAHFYDMLADHAFGNFKDVLKATTLTPGMGRYLDMLRNDKPDHSVGRIPNENYAREIKQLFSIGLFKMWPDGTLILNSKFEPVDTYTQREIVGFAHVFTGWDYGYDGGYRTTLGAGANWTRPMREVPVRHFTGPKRVLNNEVLPGLAMAAGQPLDPHAAHNVTLYSDPLYQGLAAKELEDLHNQLFNHPNVGPFICRQLLQRLVTSHPSRGYVYRVTQKFNDNGSGVRGDLRAVIKAILLDSEARSLTEATRAEFGKQREPIMRVAAAARAFRIEPWTGTYAQNGTRTITVTTDTPHRLASGNNVFLDFTSGSPAPSIGSYSIASPTNNSFTVQAAGWATGTYSIPANSTTCTVTMSNHWVVAGFQVFVDFTSGGASTDPLVDGRVYTLLTASAQTGTNGTFTFTVDTSSTSARTGNCMIPRFTPGSYTVSSSGLAAPQEKRITLDTNTNHELQVGDQVQLNFTTGNPLPGDIVATVESIVDLNTYTVLATATGNANLGTNQGDNGMYQFPLKSLPLNRSGTVGSRPSTFAMGKTDTTMDQSPLNSPTVFNYFLPDYKYAGALAEAGLTTPEFQTTAETTVMRQANYLERGVYGSGNTNGLSSFNAGSNALVMDLGPWMGNAVSTSAPGSQLGGGSNESKPWTNDENLSVLIDRLNSLLVGGQMPTVVKDEIISYVQRRSNLSAAYNQTTNPYTEIAYNNSGTPSDTEKRNRIRAILHFILMSPDFTIQR
jgi:uncharacterized protein (DUF1800 family)